MRLEICLINDSRQHNLKHDLMAVVDLQKAQRRPFQARTRAREARPLHQLRQMRPQGQSDQKVCYP
jgi:hypothetical protein